MSQRIAAALAGVLSLSFAPPAPAQTTGFQPSAAEVKAHMQFLASDLMEGREAGSRGYDLAASYVASRFLALGLKPAGDNGTYLQSTPLVSYKPTSQGAITLTRGGAATPLVFGEDYLPSASPTTPQIDVTAPLVFAGFGMNGAGRDDYAGLDVRGKIVVVLTGAPKSLNSEERAHFSGVRAKRQEAQRRGAVGLITLQTPTSERRRAFSASAKYWDHSSMTWRGRDGQAFTPAPRTPQLAMVSLKGAEKLFAGAPVPLQQVMDAAETREGRVRTFALPATARVSLRSEASAVASSNVAGMIEGSDPQLKNEVVVLSAHLDGLGNDVTPIDGDVIANGAMDNTTGVATLLEAARGFVQSGRKPRRSILFLAVTAEEKGLIGAEYFAYNPTVPARSMVANVNLDMPILSYDFQDVIAFGAERSSLGPIVRRAAARMGVKLSPDPLPEQGLFTRSDHYRFVEQGVPSVFLMTGFANGGEKQFTGFLADRYHKANDDLNQPIDYEAGAKFARLNYEIAREIADSPQRPSWNRGDFFGGLFGNVRAAP